MTLLDAPRSSPAVPSPDLGSVDLPADVGTPSTAPAADALIPPFPTPGQLPTVCLDGIEIHAISERQTIGVILSELSKGRGGTVVTPNLDHLLRASKQPSFRATVDEFDLVVADGMPLVWASRVQGQPLPERVAGSNLFTTLTEAAAGAGKSVFLLGGDPGTADTCASIFRRDYPGIRVDTYFPEFGFEHSEARFAAVADALREAQPDIVFVGLGSPKQENVIKRLQATLPRAWWLGVGISFSFVAGNVRRAPKWMRGGGEWLHRLVQEPRRLGWRYTKNGFYALRLFGRAAAARVGLAPYDRRRRAATDEPATTPALSIDVERRTSTSPSIGPMRLVRPHPAPAPASDFDGDSPEAAEAARDVLPRLREMILLGGGSLPSRMALTLGRPTLELPLRRRKDDEPDGSKMERLIDGWLRWGREVAETAGKPSLPTRLVVNDSLGRPNATAPNGVVDRPAGSFELVTDLTAHRGTGGLLHDLTVGHDPDDLVLVCTARQIMLDRLAIVARILAGRIARGADAAFVAHDDGTPVGVLMLRCELLHEVKAEGYVDLKQQVLPQAQISGRFDVRAVQARRATSMPVFGVGSYVAALTRYHAQRSGRGVEPPPLGIPLAEDFRRHFALVEDGAFVHERAYLHDAVVLRGARVEADADVIRSVVGPDAVVRRGSKINGQTIRRAG